MSEETFTYSFRYDLLWGDILLLLSQNKITVREFCRESGFNVSAYYRWKKKPENMPLWALMNIVQVLLLDLHKYMLDFYKE